MFDCSCLSLPRCRYKNVRNVEAYGQAIFSMFSTIQKHLEGEKPTRQSFLHLVKQVVDFVQVAKVSVPAPSGSTAANPGRAS